MRRIVGHSMLKYEAYSPIATAQHCILSKLHCLISWCLQLAGSTWGLARRRFRFICGSIDCCRGMRATRPPSSTHP